MSKNPQRETDRATEAYVRYQGMQKPRSLARLAKEYRAEQEAALATWEEAQARSRAVLEQGITGELAQAARVRLAAPAPKVQTLEVIERRLKAWSTAHGWQQRVADYDREEATAENARRTSEVRKLNDTHASIASTLVARATQRALAMIDSDETEFNNWVADNARARRLIAQLEAKGDLEALQKAVALSADLQKRPKPYFGAFSLVQLLDRGLETHRLAVESATRVADEASVAALPPVMEVKLTGSPPAEPVDPNAILSDVPDTLGATGPGPGGPGSAGDPLPPLVMLAGAPPTEEELEARYGPQEDDPNDWLP